MFFIVLIKYCNELFLTKKTKFWLFLNKKTNNRLKKFIHKHIGCNFEDQQELAKNILEPLNDEKKLALAVKSIKKLEEENEDTKNKIILLIEEIIFVDHQIFPAERIFYEIAKKHLYDKSLRISPSIELFEYLHVLSYASKSEIASMKHKKTFGVFHLRIRY